MSIRKIVTLTEDILIEGGREVSPAARVAVVAAIVKNPWAGQGFVEDLSAGIDATASDLGALLAPRVLEALGATAEAYGKAAIVGLNGEIEHGSGAYPHTGLRKPLPRRRQRHHALAGRRKARSGRSRLRHPAQAHHRRDHPLPPPEHRGPDQRCTARRRNRDRPCRRSPGTPAAATRGLRHRKEVGDGRRDPRPHCPDPRRRP